MSKYYLLMSFLYPVVLGFPITAESPLLLAIVLMLGVKEILAEGVTFVFDGRVKNNEKWFSWENIATKMLGTHVCAKERIEGGFK